MLYGHQNWMRIIIGVCHDAQTKLASSSKASMAASLRQSSQGVAVRQIGQHAFLCGASDWKDCPSRRSDAGYSEWVLAL